MQHLRKCRRNPDMQDTRYGSKQKERDSIDHNSVIDDWPDVIESDRDTGSSSRCTPVAEDENVASSPDDDAGKDDELGG